MPCPPKTSRYYRWYKQLNYCQSDGNGYQGKCHHDRRWQGWRNKGNVNHIDRIKSSCQAVGGPKKALECQIVQLGRKRFRDIGRPRKDFAILDYWGGRPFADLWISDLVSFSSKEWHHGVQVRHSHPKESGNRSKNGKYLKRQKGNHKIVHWKRLSNLSEMFRRHTLCHYGLLGGTSRPTVEERSIFVLLRCSVIWIYG